MMGLKSEGMIHSSAPWAHASKIDPKKYEYNRKHASEGLHYRGWTLVDVGRFRYAVSDENANHRVRVCRARTESKKAIEMFRKMIDGMEDGCL